ncbi:MAG: SRPBCC family protein [Acidobacteriota bacterium]|nr:SRPBCC family protein [Acidobacteriota bacterium]
MASLRYERRIAAPADDVWRIVRDPASIPTWFPGITSCRVEGRRRTIVTATGLEMDEEILVIDETLRRFAYRVVSPLVHHHLGLIDVVALGPEDTLCLYSTTAEPDTMALVIGGGTAGALDEIARIAEGEGRAR